jgi:hypothetical protein
VKTNTSRFPTAELRAACGPNSGDWAVFTSDVHLGDGSHLDVMAIAHRRGPEVHTYLSTHGVTTQGKPQRHKDDDLDAETGHVIARKCPSVLNDGTLAQPKIDTNNPMLDHLYGVANFHTRFIDEPRTFTPAIALASPGISPCGPIRMVSG